MAAILQTRGPVVTPQVVKNVWKFLHMMRNDQFIKAAKELEKLNLGMLVNTAVKRGRMSIVFVKKSPVETRAILEMNWDLCPISYYESRYNQPVSKSVPLSMRAYLVKEGVIASKQLT